MLKREDFRNDLTKSGELLNGAGLAYPDGTVTIALRDDKPTLSKNVVPQPEEQLTAYYVLDCADQERAVAIAQRTVDFHVTRTEIRYIHDSLGMG